MFRIWLDRDVLQEKKLNFIHFTTPDNYYLRHHLKLHLSPSATPLSQPAIVADHAWLTNKHSTSHKMQIWISNISWLSTKLKWFSETLHK